MTTTISTVATPATFVSGFGKMLYGDIEADRFADRLGTTINHPAFILGHLAYYAGVCVQLLGGDIELTEEEATLYQHGAECTDDPARYLKKDAAISHYDERTQFASDFVAQCSAEVLHTTPDEHLFSGRFETLEQIAAFMLIGHPMFHFGQISEWRRVAGMSPAG